MKASSSRFSAAGCPATEETRLSGERVITRVDSFQSTSPSSPLGRTPPSPRDLALLFSRMDAFRFTRNGACRTIETLARRIGLSRDGTRAPMQVRNGWRPSGRRSDQPAAPSKNGRFFVQLMGSTSGLLAHLLAAVAKDVGQTGQRLFLPAPDLGRVDAEHLRDLGSRLVRLDGLDGYLGLQAGWVTLANFRH